MRYVGIDLHRRYMVLAVMTEEGRIEHDRGGEDRRRDTAVE
jgi:hypothetical protein